MSSAKASQHPKYVDMICAALRAIGGKGASRQAINKYIVKEYNLTENNHHSTMLKSNLKRASAPGGPFVHCKGRGAAGSFKLQAATESLKAPSKPKQSTAKKPAKKPAAKKQKAKKAAAKKPEARKEEKKADTKSAAPKASPKPAKVSKVKAGKKSKSASPKKPKAVTAKKSPKKAPKQLPKK